MKLKFFFNIYSLKNNLFLLLFALSFECCHLQCCPLGQLLSSSGTSCIPMMSGTALPKVRVIGE